MLPMYAQRWGAKIFCSLCSYFSPLAFKTVALPLHVGTADRSLSSSMTYKSQHHHRRLRPTSKESSGPICSWRYNNCRVLLLQHRTMKLKIDMTTHSFFFFEQLWMCATKCQRPCSAIVLYKRNSRPPEAFSDCSVRLHVRHFSLTANTITTV